MIWPGRFPKVFVAAVTAMAGLTAMSAAGVARAVPLVHSGGSVAFPLELKVVGRLPDGSPRLAGATPTGLPPAAIARVYNLPGMSPTSGAGAGQIIAIVDPYSDPNALPDLNKFDAQYGYPRLPECASLAKPAPCFETKYPQGPPQPPPEKGNLSGARLETSMDIEWAHAEAPAAKIVLVEAAAFTKADMFGAVSYVNTYVHATEVSMSWFFAEFKGETQYDTVKYFAHPGTFYFAAAGDFGHEAVYPAASPDVIAVGGTTLNGCKGTSCAGFTSETAWSGSGGGTSVYEPIPGYQKNYKGPVSGAPSIFALTLGKRAIPDVSFDANPATGVSFYESSPYQGQAGWFTRGGTSVGAPNWAGIAAAAATEGRTALQGDTAIYSGAYAANLRDITTGTNGKCGAACTAGKGYDRVTGLGSPNYLLWSPAQRIDKISGLTSVSCPTSSFCKAADGDGNVYTYSGGSWSAAKPVAGGDDLVSISCPTTSFCAAITSGDTAYIYSGGAWTASNLTVAGGGSAHLTSVSCPAAGFCIATGDWDSYTYSGGTWAPGQQVQDSHDFTSISCPTTSFCRAADGGGNVYTYSGGTWSAAKPVAGGDGLTTISCPTTSFCAAVTSGDTPYVYSGGAWTAGNLIPAGGGSAHLTSVSCPSAGFCIATGDWDSYTYSGGTWAPGQQVQDSDYFTSISCPTTSFCKAADGDGNVYGYSAK